MPFARNWQCYLQDKPVFPQALNLKQRFGETVIASVRNASFGEESLLTLPSSCKAIAKYYLWRGSV
jgi:hypothetical protein